VSAGISERETSAALVTELFYFGLYFGLALGAGVVVSYLLARRLKRQTFGLELDEIASLVQEREAMLHGVKEGMIALDRADRITMVNDEARRLLALDESVVGQTLDDALPAGRTRDVLSGEITGTDLTVVTDEYILTVNRVPVSLQGRPLGAVVTLRDRTELSGLLRELNSVKGLTDALRAQHHEFANRLHTLAGLLELGCFDEAVEFLTDLRGSHAALADSIRDRVADPLVIGLLLGKATVAEERGIHLVLTGDSRLGEQPSTEKALVTILGNLIDNAMEACVAGPDPQTVTVHIEEDCEGVTVVVSDTGPGIPPGSSDKVFTDGFTTKTARSADRRGLGLALVHRLVQRLGGTISVTEGPGAVFTVFLPNTEAAQPGAPVAASDVAEAAGAAGAAR
jgi:two-component system CitB family sensor kinase